MTILNEVRKGFYLDSVALMRLSRTLAGMDGVEEAAMMMGTPANRQIMADAGLLDEAGKAAGGGDLIIGIRAVSRPVAEAALAEAGSLLDRPKQRGAAGEAWRARTLRAALKSAPDANLALISVPGDFAVAEARKAIRRGLDVMIFSDNVDLAAEADLKREAKELGRLVMGPDCGTAIINGVPLAFANVVPCGGIGIVGASGTGTQEVSCLIAQTGGGVSHAIGVGGRDLKSEIGGVSTLMALDMLDADPMTTQIVLISKPPPADVAKRVLDRVGASGKPCTICFIGAETLAMPANATQAFTLKAAARSAMGLATDHYAAPGKVAGISAGRPLIHGLFSGGTLCAEAQVLFRGAGLPLCSNAPIPGVPQPSAKGGEHVILDLGDDDFTRGRPHPMIDPTVRDGAVAAALADSEVGVVLLDVVIGHGAHEDPAGHLAALVRESGGPGETAMIASVTGTDADPQQRRVQVSKLEEAGIHVAPTNADAAAWALAAIGPRI